MEEIIIIIVRGAGAGAVYALIAMALNVIYNATGVLNFAQGQLLVVGGVLTYLWLPSGTGLGNPLWFAVLLAVAAAVGLLAALQGWLTLLPMRSASDQHSWIITTLAASIIIGAVLTRTVGPHTLSIEDSFGSFDFAGVKIPFVYILLVAVTAAIYIALRWFQRRFLAGLALNALSQDLEAAKANGVRTMRLQVLSFVIAGLIMGLGGFLAGPVLHISENEALHYTIFGFITAVVGGLGNNNGALVAGPVFGILMMFVSFQIGGSAQIPMALGALVAVLMLRPQGIFGRLHARRV